MRVTLTEAFGMIARGETPEQYEKRVKALRRYINERDDLESGISVLIDFGSDEKDAERLAKKQKRLAVVLTKIEELK